MLQNNQMGGRGCIVVTSTKTNLFYQIFLWEICLSLSVPSVIIIWQTLFGKVRAFIRSYLYSLFNFPHLLQFKLTVKV